MGPSRPEHDRYFMPMTDRRECENALDNRRESKRPRALCLARGPSAFPAVRFVALVSLCLLLAGCDGDDPPSFKRPKLTGITYLSVRVDAPDPSFGRVELTNLGKTPLTDLLVLGCPVENVALAPSETKDLGRIPLHPGGDTIVIMSSQYFWQYFSLARRADGTIEARNDLASDERSVRELIRQDASKKRWESFYAVAKFTGVTVAVAAVLIAVVVIAFVAGRRRGKRTG